MSFFIGSWLLETHPSSKHSPRVSSEGYTGIDLSTSAHPGSMGGRPAKDAG